jgi:hypothetical protein
MGSSKIYSPSPASNPALGSNPFAPKQRGWAGAMQGIKNAQFQQNQNLLMAQYKPVGSQMTSTDGSYVSPQPQLNVGTYENTIEQPKTTFNPYFGNYLNY